MKRTTKLAIAIAIVATGWLVGRGTSGDPAAPSSPNAVTAAGGGATAPTPPALPDPKPAPLDEAPNPLAIIPDSIWHPRAAGEWQGMRVDVAQPQYCEASSFCGLALACRDNKCGPCERDSHCGSGEVCVLDHCVLAQNAGCRTRADCVAEGPGALCIMNGLTGGDPRSNAQLKSYCQSPVGGVAQDLDAPDPRRAARLAAIGPRVEPPVSAKSLRARLDAELAADRGAAAP